MNYLMKDKHFAPAVMRERWSGLDLIRGYYLIKREFHVREAWEIGRHDMDSAAIHEDDAPIIPVGQENPPVLELLRWKRAQFSSSDKSPSGSG
jgi:hypothetical protein